MIWAELATGFNFVIFLFFWTILAKGVFNKPWNNLVDIITNIHLIGSHTIPLIAGMTNIYLTKGHVLLPYDFKAVLALGIFYIYWNYVGTIAEGHPMYPIADWSNFWETVILYVLLAVMEAGSFYLFAKWLCNKRNFTPHHPY